MPAMTELPSGTVTFLFTDIEGVRGHVKVSTGGHGRVSAGGHLKVPALG
jgi:hypothetical protein